MGGADGATGSGDERAAPHRETLELLPAPVALLDRDDGLIWVNAEFLRLFGPGRGGAGGVEWPEGPLFDPREQGPDPRGCAGRGEESERIRAAPRPPSRRPAGTVPSARCASDWSPCGTGRGWR